MFMPMPTFPQGPQVFNNQLVPVVSVAAAIEAINFYRPSEFIEGGEQLPTPHAFALGEKQGFAAAFPEATVVITDGHVFWKNGKHEVENSSFAILVVPGQKSFREVHLTPEASQEFADLEHRLERDLPLL